ncbi:MAG TPA: tRNA lysidine(34) synthetase TilS [Flavobacteriaceae bacterium]|nr:tRNA lysidine(34) synthetase TilS [Flavobacteriaceae bacterium]
MQREFELHLQQNFSFLYKEQFLIAISGGIDSVVLTHLCKMAGLKFALAHCNYQLRAEESDADEQFVRKLAEEYNVEVLVKKFNTAELVQKDASIQLLARNQRYQWFAELLSQKKYKYLLTAHHLNDDMETFFINLLRGTGLKGLTGIPPKNKNIIRPLLKFPKKEIEEFAKNRNLKWKEDVTNLSDDYVRNRIRHHIVPVLEKENPDFSKAFSLTQNHLKDAFRLNQDYAEALKANIVHQEGGLRYFDIKKLKAQPNLPAVLYLLLNEYNFTAWEDMIDLLDGESGKIILSKSHRLLKDRDHIILSANTEREKPEILIEKGEKIINFPAGKLICESVINVAELDNQIAYLAAKKLTYPLKLRIWRPGDRFQPFGMKGHKKVSDFLKDEKLNLFEKENTWVLLSENTVVWVVGHRIHEAFRIKESENKILKIKWLK